MDVGVMYQIKPKLSELKGALDLAIVMPVFLGTQGMIVMEYICWSYAEYFQLGQ